MTTPKLTPDAREHFREALAGLADRILDRDDAAETLGRFFGGELALMLTNKALFALPADDATKIVRAMLDSVEKSAEAAPKTSDDEPPTYGMYL